MIFQQKIIYYQMFQGQVIYKLNTIELLPVQINISPKDFTFDPLFPIYKMEIWLGNILLDQTYNITISEKKVNDGSKVLIFANKSFRYFARELFSKLKVARLKISILRGTPNWSQSQQIQVFNIVLSQYSYEYCKSKHNQFRQHSLGTLKKGFFYYKVICEYEEFIAEKQKEVEPIQNKKNEQQDVQIKVLPVNSLPDDYDFSENPSDVFIQLRQLKPVFRHESQDYDKIKIKVPGSLINANDGDSQENSVLKYKKQLKESTSSVCLYLYYIYMIVCAIVFVIQLNPVKKV